MKKIVCIFVSMLVISALTTIAMTQHENKFDEKQTNIHNSIFEPEYVYSNCPECEQQIRAPKIKEPRTSTKPLVEPNGYKGGSRGTIYVDDDADPSWYDPTHVKTIQEGVDNATTGDTIYVYNGYYPENIYVYKQVYLIGETKEHVIVDGTYTNDAFYVDVAGVSFTNFTIENGVDGITMDSVSNGMITQCIINASEYDGIWLYMSSNITITHCDTYYNGWEGIDLFPAKDCVISECYGSENGDGMCLYSDSGFYCDNNVITNCWFEWSWWAGCWISEASDNWFENCTFVNNYEAFYIQADSNNNQFINCTFSDSLDYGIDLLFTSYYNTFDHCTISGTMGGGYYEEGGCGVWLDQGAHSRFLNCDVYDNIWGFQLKVSPYCQFRNTNIYNNEYTFGFEFIYYPNDMFMDIDLSNTVDGKTMIWLDGESDIVIDETDDPGYIGLINCTNIEIVNVNVSGILMAYTEDSTIADTVVHNARRGIFLIYCSNIQVMGTLGYHNQNGVDAFESPYTTVFGCTFRDNAMINCYLGKGIYLKFSPYCDIRGTTVYNNGYEGIEAGWGSDHTTIHNCTSYNNYGACHPGGPYFGYGINIYYGTSSCTVENCTTYDNYNSGIYVFSSSTGNIISNCTSYDNTDSGIKLYSSNTNNNHVINCIVYNNQESGIYLGYASTNTITNCEIYENNYGVYLTETSNNNQIYHNNIINNTQNAHDDCSNFWDDDYPSGGNYWSDYTGEDNNGDGIGDTPYDIPGGSNQDRYPFMKPNGWEVEDRPPLVKLINPRKGYFHFSGIPLLPTPLNLLADTASLGGFRVRPITINATDDLTSSEDLLVTIYLNDEEQGNATYDLNTGYYKWKWTGWALGVYNLTITAEDLSANIGSASIDVWNFCFIP